MRSITKGGALGALAAITFIHATAATAAPAARPAPVARSAPRYTPPATNALPAFELSGYGGPGSFRLSDDTNSQSHSSTNFGFDAWGIVARHLLLAADYDYSSADFDGVTLNIGRWRYGAGYIGPMGREASWYAKVFGTSQNFGCDSPCTDSRKNGAGIGAGLIFPFERNWTGRVDLAYDHLGSSDGDPAINDVSVAGTLQYKFNRTFGLWAGVHSSFYSDSANGNSEHITLVDGRFGLSIDVY